MRGRSKSTDTTPSEATATIWSGINSEGSIAWRRAATCAEEGDDGIPCDDQSVYASPCDSSTRTCVILTLGPNLGGTLIAL